MEQCIIAPLEKIKRIEKKISRKTLIPTTTSQLPMDTSGFANVVGCYSNSNAWVALVSTLRKPDHYD